MMDWLLVELWSDPKSQLPMKITASIQNIPESLADWTVILERGGFSLLSSEPPL